MLFRKKKAPQKFTLTEPAVEFIRKYLLETKNISTSIDEDLLSEFVSIAFDWESCMVDENGNEKTYDYPEKERNEMADKFVSEISGKWSSGKWVPDLDDLNKRLGLV